MPKFFIFLVFFLKVGGFLAAGPSQYCRESLKNLEVLVQWPNGFKKFQNWDYKNIHINEIDDPKNILALNYSSRKEYLDDMADISGYFVELETPGKFLILIDSKEDSEWQATTLVHENFHRRFFLMLEKRNIASSAVLKDKKNKKRFNDLNLVIDELGAYHTGLSFVPLLDYVPSLLQSFKFMRERVVDQNKQIHDLIAIFLYVQDSLSLTLDEIKYHHLLLAATKVSWKDLDQLIHTRRYREYRRSFYNVLENIREYELPD
ncbi:MAG: hypothetical protein VX642_01705 [Bdellovibrionota bacterium]|nr:hypothetical protein [Bdellovibrionota bacterium]